MVDRTRLRLAPEDEEGGGVHLVIMTHTALTGDFRAAGAELDRRDRVVPPSVYYPVGDRKVSPCKLHLSSLK